MKTNKFFNQNNEEKDRYLDLIERQLTRIVLQVSYIENKISNYETRTDSWKEKPLSLNNKC